MPNGEWESVTFTEFGYKRREFNENMKVKGQTLLG
jgi:hypothetical protein